MTASCTLGCRTTVPAVQALPESENLIPGGRVFRYEGGATWTDCGKVGEGEAIGGMTVYCGRLYASSMYAPAGLYRYEGGTEWFDCGNPNGRVESLALYDGHLYGSGWDLGRSGVYRYDDLTDRRGDKGLQPLVPGERGWTDCGTPAGVTQTYSFARYRGRLYAGTWPSGKVFRYAGEKTWEDCGQLGDEQEVMPMAVYNGKLYAGTLPLAAVYRYDGDGQWRHVGQLDFTPDVKYRRVWSMAIYQGKLFCGVLPSGHVHAFEAGQCVTYDRELNDGWRHLAAVRHGDTLRLYIDGKLAAASASTRGCNPLPPSGSSSGKALDIANDKPLIIGFGAHDYFNGRMRDIRVYRRVLWDEEIGNLHRARQF